MTDELNKIKCPFCGEDDFDLIGLKYHLINYCDEYKNTPPIELPIDSKLKEEK